MDVVFLHNEGAGQGDYSRTELMRLMRRSRLRPKYFPLNEALRDPRIFNHGEFVIAAGGDGSVRTAALAMLGTGRYLAPLPIGTANNIAHSVGLNQSPEQIIAGWSEPRRIKLDVGRAEGPWGVASFVEGVGFGVFCRTIELLSELDEVSSHEIEKSDDRLHRDTVVALTLAHEFSAVRIQLTADKIRRSGQFVMMEVLNIPRAGPAVELAPAASPCDGYFDLVGVTAQERSKLIALLRSQLTERKTPALGQPSGSAVESVTAGWYVSDRRQDFQIQEDCEHPDFHATRRGESPVATPTNAPVRRPEFRELACSIAISLRDANSHQQR